MYDFFQTEDLKLWEEDLKTHLRKISFEEKILELRKLNDIVEENIKKFALYYGKDVNIVSKVLDSNSIEILVDMDNGKKINNGYIIYDDSTKEYKFILGQHFIEKGLQASEPMILEELDNWMASLLNELG
ncbi:hypothetical protein [Clostridium lundense]|uniref:hypothetical protein n=1 Tax=Clostridium lundense TaxID=319475 RepID=UPI00047F2BEE|nr:hypothetical protein [Clostridium lundense]